VKICVRTNWFNNQFVKQDINSSWNYLFPVLCSS